MALVFAVLLTFLVSGVGSRPVGAEMITLKAVTAWPKTVADSKGLLILMEVLDQMIAEKAPGELKINYIGGPEAVKTNDQVESLKRGMIDMVYTAGAYYTGVLPEIDALKLTEYTPAEERANGVLAYLNDLHEKRLGISYLGRLGLGTKFYLYLNKPIKAADLKGLNIRVSPYYLQVIKGLGGNPVVMPPTDVYQALERNVVDGYCWPAVGIRDWGWQKVTKYQVDPGFYQVVNILLMNQNSYNKLPKKLKDILRDATIEAENRTMAYFEDVVQKERPALMKEGIHVLELPPAEKEKFLKIAYDEGWKDVIQKAPKTGSELRKLLSRSR